MWIIWSTITVTATRPVTTRAICSARPPIRRVGLMITAGIDHRFTITPAAIITDADRPALHCRKNVPVPGAETRHVLNGQPLGPGALLMWDASRQIQVKVLNPRLYTAAQIGTVAVGSRVLKGQPQAVTIPEFLPDNDAIGNDDTSICDEDNDPYEAPNRGAVTGMDNASWSMLDATGADGDTFEVRLHFREFMRVNLGNTWFRASDFSPWRFHTRFIRVAREWTDNVSDIAPNNAGF